MNKLFPFMLLCLLLSACRLKEKTQAVIATADPQPTREWLKVLVGSVLPDSVDALVWIPTGDFSTSSLIRVPRYPRGLSDQELRQNPALKDFIIQPIAKDTLRLEGISGEQLSAQIAVVSKKDISQLHAVLSPLQSATRAVSEENIQVRYPGYVPVERAKSEYEWSAKYENVRGEGVSGNMNPSLVADPLYEVAHVNVPAYAAQPVWLTVKLPKDTPTGHYIGELTLSENGEKILTKSVQVKVFKASMQEDKSCSFFMDMWFNPYALADYYHYPLWGEKHWAMTKVYLQDLASRSNKTITTTITDSPWLIASLNKTLKSQNYTPYGSMVKWIYTKNDHWKFDYQIFDRFVETAMASGMTERIHAYSMTNFSGRERLHFFDQSTAKDKVIVLDSIQDTRYQTAWTAFLKDFKSHLQSKGWLKRTYLSFDERPQEVMAYVLGIVKKHAPEFLERISIAGHPESHDYATGYLSISYEFFPNQNLYKPKTLDVIEARNQQETLTTFYLCGQPEHPNTLSYSPAIEAQMIPLLALSHHLSGYTRWAYCNWTDDPIKKPVFNYNQGDEYIVYPGKTGPLSSIRWELFKEGIEDYELLCSMITRGRLDAKQKERILKLYTQSLDGRRKRASDIMKAKALIFSILEK